MSKEIPNFQELQKTLSPEALQKAADKFLEEEGLGLSLNQKNRPKHIQLEAEHTELVYEDPVEPFNQDRSLDTEIQDALLFIHENDGSVSVTTEKPKRKRVATKEQSESAPTFPNKNFSLEASTAVLEGFLKHFKSYLNEETQLALSDTNSPLYAEFRDVMSLNQQALLQLLVGKMAEGYEITQQTKTEDIPKKHILWQNTKNNTVFTAPKAGELKQFFQGNNATAQRINRLRGEYIKNNTKTIDAEITKLLQTAKPQIDLATWQKDLLLSIEDIKATTQKLRTLFEQTAVEQKVLSPEFEALFTEFTKKRGDKEVSTDDVRDFAIGLLFQEHFGIKPTEFALGLRAQHEKKSEKPAVAPEIQKQTAETKTAKTPLALFDELVTPAKINPALQLTEEQKQKYIQQLRAAVAAGKDNFEDKLKKIQWGETKVPGKDGKVRKINHNAYFLQLGSQNTTVTGTNIVSYCFEKGVEQQEKKITPETFVAPIAPSTVSQTPGPLNTPDKAALANATAWNEQKTENPTAEHEYFEMIAEMYQLHKYLSNEELFEFEFTLFENDGFSLAERAGNLSALLLSANTRARTAGDGNAILDRVRVNYNGKTVALLAVAKDLIASTQVEETATPVATQTLTPLEQMMQAEAPVVEAVLPPEEIVTEPKDPEIQELVQQILGQIASIYDNETGSYERNLFATELNSVQTKKDLLKIFMRLRDEAVSSFGWRQVIVSLGGPNVLESLIKKVESVSSEAVAEPIIPAIVTPEIPAQMTVEQINTLRETELAQIEAGGIVELPYQGKPEKHYIETISMTLDGNLNASVRIGETPLVYSSIPVAELQNQVNAKYDAEIAALQNQEEGTEVALQPIMPPVGMFDGGEVESVTEAVPADPREIATALAECDRKTEQGENTARKLSVRLLLRLIEKQLTAVLSVGKDYKKINLDALNALLLQEYTKDPKVNKNFKFNSQRANFAYVLQDNLFDFVTAVKEFDDSADKKSTQNTTSAKLEKLQNAYTNLVTGEDRAKAIANCDANEKALLEGLITKIGGYYQEVVKDIKNNKNALETTTNIDQLVGNEVDRIKTATKDNQITFTGIWNKTPITVTVFGFQTNWGDNNTEQTDNPKLNYTTETITNMMPSRMTLEDARKFIRAKYEASDTEIAANNKETEEMIEAPIPEEVVVQARQEPEIPRLESKEFAPKVTYVEHPDKKELGFSLDFCRDVNEVEARYKITQTGPSTAEYTLLAEKFDTPEKVRKGLVDLFIYAVQPVCEYDIYPMLDDQLRVKVLKPGKLTLVEKDGKKVWQPEEKLKISFEYITPEKDVKTIPPITIENLEQTPTLTDEEKAALMIGQQAQAFDRPRMDDLINLNNAKSSGSGILDELWSLQMDLAGWNWNTSKAFLEVLKTYLPSAHKAMIDCGALENSPRGITSKIQEEFLRSADTRTIKVQMQKVFDFCKNLGK